MMVVDHQKEEEYKIWRIDKNSYHVRKKERGVKVRWQDIKMNNAVYAVEKVKNYS